MITMQTFFDVMSDYLHRPIAVRAPREGMITKAAEAASGEIQDLRLTEVYWPLVLDRMQSLLSEQFPLAAVSLDCVPAHARMKALLHVMDETDGGEKLREEFPELARLDRVVRTGFESLISEILSLAEEKRAEISRQFFAGRDFGRITAIRLPWRKFQQTRTRPGGRMTLCIETEGGTFYYKPHSAKPDQVYSRLTGRFFPELHVGNRTVDCGSASFAEAVPKLPLSCEAECATYYTRMGLLAALYYVLGGQDLHSENIIPHGAVPVAIDVEVLLGHQMPGSALEPVIEMAPADRAGVFTPLYATGDDEYSINREDANGHLPVLHGRKVTVEGFEEAFIAGFADGFRRMRENAGEILSLLKGAADTPIRIGIRRLQMYPVIFAGMLQPDRLRSVAARDAWLEKAWELIPEKWRASYRELERDDLLLLDIPGFHICIGDGTIRHTEGRGSFPETLPVPLDCVKARLPLLTEECLDTCIRTLRANLTAVPGGSKP